MHNRPGLVTLALLSACGCGGGGGAGDPDAAPGRVDAAPGEPDAGGPSGPALRYLLARVDGGFAVSAIDPATGALRPVWFQNVSGVGTAIARLHPDGRYIATTTDKLHVLGIDAATGTLDDVAGSPFDIQPLNRAFAFHPGGELLFAALADQTLRSYGFDPDTGDVTSIPGPPTLGGSPIDLVVHPDGKLLYVTAWLGGLDVELDGYGVGTDGTLTRLDDFPLQADDGGWLAMSPTGGHLVSSGDRNVHVLEIDPATGALDEVAGSPVERDDAIGRASFSPAGDMIYLPHDDDVIEGFTVEGGTLGDAPDSPYLARTASSPRWVTVDPTGAFAYAGSTSGGVDWYDRDADGALVHGGHVHGWFPSPSQGGDVLVGPAPVAFAARRLYAFEYGVGVHTYAIDPDTGALDERGDPFETDLSYRQMGVRPQGDVLYAVDTSQGLSGWRIGGNGAIAALEGSPYVHGGAPRAMGYTPSGNIMLMARSTQQDVIGRVLTTDGMIAGVAAVSYDVATPIEVKTPGTGGNVWIANTGDDTLTLEFLAYDGTISAGQTPLSLGAGTNPTAIAFSPDGRHAYVVLEGTGEVAAFANSPMNENPTEIDRYDAGTTPHAVAVHPSGRYVYVSDTGSAVGGTGDSILAYRRNVKTGALTPLSPASFPCLPRPWAMEVDPSGRFLVVGATGITDPVKKGGVSVLRIAEDGTLGAPDDTVLTGGVFALSILGERD